MANTPLFIPELGDKFIDYRDEIWGDSYNWSWNRSIDQVIGLAIHHTVTSKDATPDDIALLHKARGWSGVGYHFIITSDGNVWYVGDIGTARAHVLNKNEKYLGISLVGDFTRHLPSDEQITSTHKLCKFFIEVASVPNVDSWDKVYGHKELQATACPGSSWDKSVSGDMWWRIKTNTIYSPVQPPEQEETYKIIYKDEVIATYEYNPVDRLEECSKKLQAANELVSELTMQKSKVDAELIQQEKDNSVLLAENHRLSDEKSSCQADLLKYKSRVEQQNVQIVKLENKIKQLESTDPLSAYTRWELLKMGLFGKPKGGDDNG